jgi:CHAD domain-containing protein
MPDQHEEIERKFDVAAGFVLPDLTALDGVARVEDPEERQLEAVYHDTPDLRLARARVTLRRRTGGPDAGWHLKLPARHDARRELHEALGRTTPPPSLLTPLAGLLRGPAVEPVVILQTRRLVTLLRDAEDRPLAEVADDEVTATVPAPSGAAATVLSWHELEVELVEGDERLLPAAAQALTAAGARPSAWPSKLARALGERLAALDGAGAAALRSKRMTAGDLTVAALRKPVAALQAADLMVRTDQPDAVHQVRVACRRLRSVLTAMRGVLDESRTELLQEELTWLGAELSATRDAEVTLTHLAQTVAGQPVELVLGPVAARIQQVRVAEDLAGREHALRVVSEDRYLRLLDAVSRLAAEPPLTPAAAEPAREVVLAALHKSGRRLFRLVRAAPDLGTTAALHDVRKAAKRVRYTAEIARPVLGGRAKALARCMAEVQEVLGALVDSAVARERCRELGVAAHAAGENAWTYGRLHALEEARAARAVADFWALEPELRPVVRRVTGRRARRR